MVSPTRFLIVTCLLALSCPAAEFDPFAGPKPIFVFIETDPWLMVIGSDTPRLALYETGELIFTSKVDGRFAYRHQTLDSAALDRFKQRIKTLENIKDLRPRYNVAPFVTDQPEAQFYFRSDRGEITTQVYGLMGNETRLPAWTVAPGGLRPDRLPDELLKLHQLVSEYQDPASPEWIPPCVELMLWPYEYAPEESIHWPSDWPSLESEQSRKRGDMYRVFLDGADLLRLEAFLASRREKGAVEVEGKKWAAEYRYTFPSESMWRKAFREAPETFPLTLRDRVENLRYTAQEACSYFLYFWIPSLVLALLAVVLGAMRVRGGTLAFSRWVLLAVPLLIPITIAFISCGTGLYSPREQIKAVRTILLILLLAFVPIAGAVIIFCRGSRWFALSIALLQTWITLCVFVASISAIL